MKSFPVTEDLSINGNIYVSNIKSTMFLVLVKFSTTLPDEPPEMAAGHLLSFVDQ